MMKPPDNRIEPKPMRNGRDRTGNRETEILHMKHEYVTDDTDRRKAFKARGLQMPAVVYDDGEKIELLSD